MNLEIRDQINREHWLASLGVKGDAARDEALLEQLDEGERLLFEAAKPKAVYKIMAREDVKTEGIAITKHLEGCHKVAIMGVTLGIGVDNLLRQTQVKDMAMAVILDCGASVLIEQMCDEFEKIIKNENQEYMTSRFSPGYGDYPIEYQRDIVRYIDGQRQIGLNVTANSLMVPRKSVTALIGMAGHPVTGKLATCNQCVLKDKCTIRKEGKFCGN
jgi:hypothetical protein